MEDKNKITTENLSNEKKAWVIPALTDEAFADTKSGKYNTFQNFESFNYHS